jgi:type VI secretion system protein ImpH
VTANADKTLIQDLLSNGHTYSFFQVIRKLQAQFPDAPRLGHQGPPQHELVKLRPHLGMSHPRTDIAAIHQLDESGKPVEHVYELDSDANLRLQLDVTFMGLYGTSSPLPMHYTEDLVRKDDHETLLRGFLDLFHHRLLSLFYRVWEKYRYSVQYDTTGKDYFSRRLLSLIGASLENLPPDGAMPPGKMLSFAGLLTQHPRSAESLRAAVQHHFPEGRVEVVQCKGRWTEIAPDQRTSLGKGSCSLGSDTMLGSRVYDCAGNFGVRMGPLAIEDYLNLMPGKRDIDQLRELVDTLNSDGLDYEVTLILRGEDVPRAQLNAPLTRLGWSSWLGDTDGEDKEVTLTFKGWRHGRG